MHTSIVQRKQIVRTILSLWDFMYYLKDIPFLLFFLTQHEWCCFKHEKISFFLDLTKVWSAEGDYKIVAVPCQMKDRGVLWGKGETIPLRKK